jgi:hypothetical protein
MDECYSQVGYEINVTLGTVTKLRISLEQFQ